MPLYNFPGRKSVPRSGKKTWCTEVDVPVARLQPATQWVIGSGEGGQGESDAWQRDGSFFQAPCCSVRVWLQPPTQSARQCSDK